MAANVEIKARAPRFREQCHIAAQLASQPGQRIHQEDIFYIPKKGRLKLRIFSPERGELIAYERHDEAGPKTSSYFISPTNNPLALKKVLDESLTIRGVVRKTRHLFMVGRTRIHMDEVEGLGHFLELEVVLQAGETPEQGQREAQDLMERLAIDDGDLVRGAYIDLLEKQQV